MQDVVWFKDVDKGDVGIVGGKGANLGELIRTKVPVPNGFIITASAYFEAVKLSGALDRIKGILFELNVEDSVLLESKARACQAEIKKIKLDRALVTTISRFYKNLSGTGNPYVAVRSSATAEDLPEASFAGQQATFLNVKGKNNLISSILACWASLFEPRAIFYRVEKKFDHFKVGIAVPVQLMVSSEVSGVMFTADPVTSDKNKIIIEAIYGLGELIVSGQITPDHYEVNKDSLEIFKKNIVDQKKQLLRIKGENKQSFSTNKQSFSTNKQSFSTNKLTYVSAAYAKKQKLPDQQIRELAIIGKEIENHYFFPQDIEWAYEDGKIFIVQTRPITTLKAKKTQDETDLEKVTTDMRQPILIGAPASPAIAIGPVVIIHSPRELAKVKKGDVLVTEMTNPDFVPAMKRAVAIVTNLGGRTSHAAIVSRELGIACVVGTQSATKVLKDGQIVTVDGQKGHIFKGSIKPKTQKELRTNEPKRHTGKTATHLYVNLAEPDLAPKIATRNVDGIGLLRAEFILAQIGTHPKKFIKTGRQSEFIEDLAKNLTIFARSFDKRPVIYRATDLKSNEYRNLDGGELYEPHEPNPMLGYRGAYRYIKDPDVFKLELEAIKQVRQKYDNLHLMIPYVRSIQELRSVKTLVAETGLFKDHDFKFWMMVEIPVNVIMLEDFIKVGLDGISIGSNDLTMLILGTDRDNEEVATEFDEMSPAVLWALEKIVKTCAKFDITTSICGQAPSTYPALTQKLVSWGITSISVNPDVIDETREIIYQAEHKIING